MDGSGYDPDGTITSYEWLPADKFVDNDVAAPLFTDTDDDGSIAVNLTVCDNGVGPEQQCDTDSATVTVTNAAPMVTPLIGAQNLTQGDTLGPLDLASFTDAGTLDTHEFQILWGDGTSEAYTPTGSSTISGSHQYTRAGSWTLRIRVRDDDGGIGEATVPVTVANVAPVVTPGTPSVVEGDSTNTTLATASDVGSEILSATVDLGCR